MIKAIFFDFDGVLTPHPSGAYSTCSYISGVAGIALDTLIKCYKIGSGPRNLGTQPVETAWDSFWKRSGIPKNMNLLTQAFLNTPKNEAMFGLAKKLKNSGYTTGIITDNNILRWEILEKEWKLEETFEIIIVSCREGIAKYDGTNIYSRALFVAGLNPEETAFVDNKQRNAEAASSIGMHGIYFDEKRNSIAALTQTLRELGIKIK